MANFRSSPNAAFSLVINRQQELTMRVTLPFTLPITLPITTLPVALLLILYAATVLSLRFLLSFEDDFLHYAVGYFTLCALYTAFALYSKRSPVSIKAVILLSTASVLTFVASPAILSDDLYRYAWEGRIGLAGINPYSVPPEEVSGIESDPIGTHVNHKEYPAIYPPLFQTIMQGTVSLSYSIESVRFLMLLFHLIACRALYLLLKHYRKPVHLTALYALNPLVVLEVGAGAHLDTLGAAFLLLTLLAYAKQRYSWTSVWWGCAIGIKWIPIMLLPLLWRAFPPAMRWRLCLALIPVLAPYILFIDAGPALFFSLAEYLTHWEFNAPFYYLLKAAGVSKAVTKVFAAMLLLGILGWLTYSGRALYHKFSSAFAAYFLLSPVCHPWYFLWVVSLLPLTKNWAWATLSFTLFLSYSVVSNYHKMGVWTETPGIIAAQFIPPLLVWVLLRLRRNHSF